MYEEIIDKFVHKFVDNYRLENDVHAIIKSKTEKRERNNIIRNFLSRAFGGLTIAVDVFV